MPTPPKKYHPQQPFSPTLTPNPEKQNHKIPHHPSKTKKNIIYTIKTNNA
jgi:hypothetical protein